MAYANLKELLSATCDAIRLKEGSKGLINHQDIPNRIEGLNNLETSSLSDIHIWEKSTATEEFTVNEIEETDVTLSYSSTAGMDEWDTVSYADEIAIIEGKIILVNPTSITLSSSADRAALKGKYLYTTHSERYYRIPTDATLTYSQGTYHGEISASVAMRLTVTTTEVDGGELIGYVVSSDKADYPENGNVGDGYKYVYIGTAESNEGLDTSDATAVADDILKGKTAYANGRKITGTHECAGDTSETVEQATPTIEVSKNSGLITATAEQIAGYVKAGTKSATKQLTTQAAKTYTPGTSDQTIASGKYLTGAQTIEGDSNLVEENIRYGKSIFGVPGSYTGEGSGGLVAKNGEVVDSTVIETGLSSVSYFMLYKTSFAKTGLIQAIYGNDDENARTVVCSSYGTYTKTVGISTCTPTIEGGTITWPYASTSSGGMSEGVTYKWVAFGTE